MKKQHLFIILSVVLLGFVFGVIQYYQALKTEDVSAVTVGIPNPGHSLAQLECSATSLCVDTTNNRVGIGTNNPTQKLDVSSGNIQLGDSRSTSALFIGFFGHKIGREPSDGSLYIGGGQANIILQNNVGIGTTSPGAKLDIKGDTSNWGTMAKIFLTDSNTNTASRNWSIGNGGSAFGNLSFYVSTAKDGVPEGATATHIMSLQSSGNVGIGTTSPSYTLTVAGTAWVTSGSWSGSDIRWKKNINTLSQSSSLEKVMALNPVNYQWKTDEYPEMKFSSGTQLGFIAQDVEKIIPEVVTLTTKDTKESPTKRLFLF